MNRRDVLKTMVAVASTVAAGASVTSTAPKYGSITVERHRLLCQQGVHLHVMHHGRDITLDCWHADDTGEGMAKVFLRNANGRRFPDCATRSAASAIVQGVTLIEGAPFTGYVT